MANDLKNKPRPATAGASPKYKTVTVDTCDDAVEDEEAVLLYRWLDSLQFSRSQKTSANRDFADGVMMAELVANYIPKIINSMYYIPASATSKKIENWENLNNKVFKRIGFHITPKLIKELASAKPGMIERVLKPLQPILLKGPRAVLPVLKKLENVKSRFLDFEKSYLKNTFERQRPRTATVNASDFSTPNSTVNTSARASPSCQRASSLRNSGPRVAPFKSAEAIDVEMIKSPRSYRSSTGSTLNRPPSPNDVLTGTNTLKEKSERQKRTLVSSRRHGFPARSSWLPVEGEELTEQALEHTSNKNAIVLMDSEATDGYNVPPNSYNDQGIDNDEDIDGEIFCDQSGYEEDTEDDDEEGDSEANNFEPSSGDQRSYNGASKSKRKLKRVIKYEYREEYILNGMASMQFPNSAQLEKVRKNYMSPGNNDPNCRGYGFV